jgi:hypothetical protein
MPPGYRDHEILMNMTDPRSDLSTVVARAVDQAALGASAPALLLEVQAFVGLLAARSNQLTNRGVRPFRPDGEWAHGLGQLAFAIYNLADQTGVELDGAIRVIADEHVANAVSNQRSGSAEGWPFPTN